MKILIYFLIIVLWSINMEAKVKLPPLLSDNMAVSYTHLQAVSPERGMR